jgi:hypothetical protein
MQVLEESVCSSQELVRVLGSPSASPRVRFDCVMLLSDLLESAVTAQARADERGVPAFGCGTCDGAGR